jgi:hypothetical protein
VSEIEFAASGPGTSETLRAPSARTRRRAIVLGVLAGFLTAILLLVADAALASRRMLSDISAARNALIEGGNAVVTGDPATATRFFTDAAADADAAVAAAGRPGIRLFGSLPIVSDNVAAATAVAQAQADTARAGTTMAQAAGTLRWENILLPGATTLGDIDLRTLKAAAPRIESVATQLQSALHRLELAGTGRLFGPVAAGYDDAVETLTRQAALAADARDLMKVAPGLLGGKGERRYLVAVQSLAQPHGSGGRVVATGVLTARAGVVTLEPLAPADSTIADAAASPDVPTSAETMLAAASAAGLDPLNGVILVDTVGLQDLLWMVGDVETDAWPVALSQNDAVSTLDDEVLQGTDVVAANELQAALSGEILTQALTRRPSTEVFGTGAAQLVAGRHLAIFSTDKAVQTLLSRLGATGRLVVAGNPLAVVWNTTGPARTGALVRRPTSVGVTLDAQGVARMRAVVDLENQAPNGPPSVLLGRPFVDEPVGGYAADVSVYLPRGAEQIGIETSTPSESVVTKDADLGLPVATAPVSAPPGGSMSMIVTAQVPQAATLVGDGFEYRIRIVPQPSAVPESLRVQIKIPEGMVITGASEGVVVGGTVARFVGTPQGTVVLIVRYA